VLVRARCKADIFNLFRKFSGRYKMTRSKADKRRDYRWRLSMRRRDWAKILATPGDEIDYGNFKNAVHERGDQNNKRSAYLAIWAALLRVQHLEDERGEPKATHVFDWPDEMSEEADLLPEDQWRSSRFDDPPPEPTTTIKSVTTGEQQ
jgi:hypothetical protein